MSTLSPYASPSDASRPVDQTNSKSPFWKIGILVGINLLSVPLAVPLIYGFVPLSPELDEQTSFVLFGIYHGYLFLLAYWMAFGGTPKTGRHIIATGLAMLGAAPIAIMMAHQTVLQRRTSHEFGWDELPALLPFVFGPPLIAATIVWLLNAAFMIPQYFGRVVITFQELQANTLIPSGNLTVARVLTWVVMLGIPCGLYALLFTVDPRVEHSTTHILISTLFSLIALTPAALLLVTDTNFGWKLIASAAWAVIAMIGFLMIPPEWSSQDTIMLHVATTTTVFLNLLILRTLGLRRLPTTTAPPAVAQ